MKINKLRKDLVRQFKAIMKSNSSPESMAMGFSLGTLIVILPTPGFGIFIALFIALLFKKINKVAILASFTLWNPIIIAPIYWLSFELGNLIFRPDPSIKFDLAILDQLYHYSGKFMLGNVMIAIFMSIISYMAVYLLAVKYLRKEKVEEILEPVKGKK